MVAMGASAVVSVTCCIAALSMVVAKRLCRRFTYRLASYQVLGSLMQSTAMALQLMVLNYNKELEYYTITCTAIAFVLQYSLLMKLMFTNWLTFHIFLYAVFLKNLQRLDWVYMSTSLVIPFLIACVPLLTNSYGLSGAWCYVRSWNDDCATDKYLVGIVEQFSMFYGPAALCLVINIAAIAVMLVVLTRRAHRSRLAVRQGCERENQLLTAVRGADRDPKVQLLKQLLPLLAYPIIYFALFLNALLNRLYMAVAISINYEFMLSQAVSFTLTGFFAGLALILHITIVFFRPRRWPISIRAAGYEAFINDRLTAVSGATRPWPSYTSGAVTRYSLPNETEVDNIAAALGTGTNASD